MAERAAPPDPPTWFRVRRIFLRSLGLVHLIAFGSLWLQIGGLVGADGILPVAEHLDAMRAYLGDLPWLRMPTLLWLSSVDSTLHLLCAAGVGLSLLLLLGVATVPILLGLWAAYLSLVHGGQIFLAFQWDTLLLETTLLAMFLVPWRWDPQPAAARPPSPVVGIWLLRLLLFKLLFLSGAVKLLSLDPSWLQLTALDVHYETQPLPLATSWWVHQLPPEFHRISLVGLLVAELLVPFSFFGPRRLRLIGFWITVALQLLIAATGNYGFFNLNTLVLCTSLLDDRALVGGRRVVARLSDRPLPIPRTRVLLAVVLAALSLVATARELVRTAPLRGLPPTLATSLVLADQLVVQPAAPVSRWLDPFLSINGYGLFRSMTTTRPEIVLEVSRDGLTWREVEFRYKPVALNRRPRLAAPHMPRLDWQMWFAALAPQRAAWLRSLAASMLRGDAAVLRLLGDQALIDGEQPEYVRFVLYRYHFTSREERRATGAWWARERLAEPSRPIARVDALIGS